MIPPDAELTARPAEIPAWDDMPDDLKPVLARQMEVYAGFLEHTDHHVGRLVDALADLGVLDDTLDLLHHRRQRRLRRGHPQRHASTRLITLNGAAGLETTEFMASRIDDFGTPTAYNHYAVGWAHAMDTPVPVDQAGRLALGRHPQRHDRALAQRHRRPGARSAPSSTTSSTSPRPCSRRPGCPSRVRQRRAAEAAARA